MRNDHSHTSAQREYPDKTLIISDLYFVDAGFNLRCCTIKYDEERDCAPDSLALAKIISTNQDAL